MPLRLVHKKFVQWDTTTQRKLRTLTLGTGSYGERSGYVSTLAWWIKDYPKRLDTFVCFDKDEPVAWCVRMNQANPRHPDATALAIYVRSKWRRQGIGTRLYRAMNRAHGRCKVYPWNKPSRGFFAAAQHIHRCTIIDTT